MLKILFLEIKTSQKAKLKKVVVITIIIILLNNNASYIVLFRTPKSPKAFVPLGIGKNEREEVPPPPLFQVVVKLHK